MLGYAGHDARQSKAVEVTEIFIALAIGLVIILITVLGPIWIVDSKRARAERDFMRRMGIDEDA